MKGYLLDTHVLLWWLSDQTKIRKQARAVIKDPSNTLYLSAGAIWEMAIKRVLGRLDFPNNLLEVLQRERISVMEIKAEHALEIMNLPLLHHDPFDRIQIAQALIERLCIISHDEKFADYKVEVVVA